MRLDGNALLSALRYELEKLRCSAWGEVYTAKLPEEVAEGKVQCAGARKVRGIYAFVGAVRR
jgi:hypothetical protein